MSLELEPVASTSAAPADPARQIAVRLSTKDKAYEIPSTKFLVPANWRRFHLSELINKVLENCTCSRFFVLFFFDAATHAGK